MPDPRKRGSRHHPNFSIVPAYAKPLWGLHQTAAPFPIFYSRSCAQRTPIFRKKSMKPNACFIALASALALAAGQASATTLTFEDLAEGTTLSNQYAAQGAIFSPNGFAGAGGPTGSWATNTDMTITTIDVGGLGTPTLVSGNMLHAFGSVYPNAGWLSEDGDASFLITFTSPMNFISADFGGVSTPADVRLVAFNGATQLANVTSGVTTGQYTLSFSAPSITSVIITPGSFNDWVGVDNITFTAAAVPEVSTYAMMGAGLALLALRRRKSA